MEIVALVWVQHMPSSIFSIFWVIWSLKGSTRQHNQQAQHHPAHPAHTPSWRNLCCWDSCESLCSSPQAVSSAQYWCSSHTNWGVIGSTVSCQFKACIPCSAFTCLVLLTGANYIVFSLFIAILMESFLTYKCAAEVSSINTCLKRILQHHFVLSRHILANKPNLTNQTIFVCLFSIKMSRE